MPTLKSLGSNTPNPDPLRFEIMSVEEHTPWLLALVRYLNCTTFEGHKLLLFHGVDGKWIYSLKSLDPHFCENFPLVARFHPSNTGVNLARSIMGIKTQKEPPKCGRSDLAWYG